MRNFVRTGAALLVVLSLVALLDLWATQPALVPLAAARPAVDSAQLVPLGPAAALPTGAVSEGAVDPAQPLTVDLVLRPRGLAALHDLADQVSVRGGASSGRLAPGGFAQRFGGSPVVAAEVRRMARGAGLSTAPATLDGLFQPVTGTAGQLEHFFHTHLSKVRLADGTTGRRASVPAQLPRSVASSVTSVVGLDDLTQREPVSLLARSVGTDPSGSAGSEGPSLTADSGQLAPHACAAAQADDTNGGVFTDDALAALYGANGLFQSGADGNGQTIAVYELEPFAPSDVAAFDTCYFGAAESATMSDRLHVIPVDGGQAAGTGVGEAALDVENVSALAPGAQIDVYEAPNTTAGSLDEFSRIIADDTASVVTTSAGLCEAAMQSDEPGVQAIENVLFEQAAAQGQTVVAAAGDDGSSDCGDRRQPRRATEPVRR
jgi:subtilase family serine protease